MNRAQRRYLDAAIRQEARGRIHTRPTIWAWDDARWFKANRDRSHRVRPRFSDEWFLEPDDAPDLDMVSVWQIEPGFRLRSPFEIPPSACAEHVRAAAETELGAATLFDLAFQGMREVRCGVLMALLERGGCGGRADPSKIESVRQLDHQPELAAGRLFVIVDRATPVDDLVP